MKTIVFDFDGTIANTLERIVEIYNDVAPRFRCRHVSASDLDRMRNGRPQDFMREFGINYLKLPILLWVVRKKLRQDVARLPLQGGMKEVLEDLSKKEVRLGILTSNSKENVEAFLRANGLNDAFAFVISHNSMFGKSKPLSQLKTKIGQLAYVGDEVRDIEAAKKSGVTSVAVTWGFQSAAALQGSWPEHLIGEPTELLKL